LPVLRRRHNYTDLLKSPEAETRQSQFQGCGWYSAAGLRPSRAACGSDTATEATPDRHHVPTTASHTCCFCADSSCTNYPRILRGEAPQSQQPRVSRACCVENHRDRTGAVGVSWPIASAAQDERRRASFHRVFTDSILATANAQNGPARTLALGFAVGAHLPLMRRVQDGLVTQGQDAVVTE
jgi:hypothetical protein